MTEKIPNFVKRVQFYKPYISVHHNRDRGGINLSTSDIEAIIAMSGTPYQKKYEEERTEKFSWGTIGEQPIEWCQFFARPNGLLWRVHPEFPDDRYIGHYAISPTTGYVIDFDSWSISDKIDALFGIKEWRNCHKYYSQKYEAEKKEFETKNPVWQQLKALDSPKVKATMSEDEQKAMRNLYETKLKKDPDYQDLQDLKQDIFDLATYVKYLEKQEKSEERKGLKGRLESLKTEYDSTEIKEALPDEKRRLSVRGAMHKKLKKQAGM